MCVIIDATDKQYFTHKGERMFINIEVERLRRYMSRNDMANALSISAETLNDWIGQKRPIPAEGLRALCRLFKGCSLDYLLKERR